MSCGTGGMWFNGSSGRLATRASISEARVLGKLGDHPNVARVVDQCEDDQAAIMVSRYFHGGILLDLIARSRDSGENVPAERILQVAAEITDGLVYIHGRRILYLDLQPGSDPATVIIDA